MYFHEKEIQQTIHKNRRSIRLCARAKRDNCCPAASGAAPRCSPRSRQTGRTWRGRGGQREGRCSTLQIASRKNGNAVVRPMMKASSPPGCRHGRHSKHSGAPDATAAVCIRRTVCSSRSDCSRRLAATPAALGTQLTGSVVAEAGLEPVARQLRGVGSRNGHVARNSSVDDLAGDLAVALSAKKTAFRASDIWRVTAERLPREERPARLRPVGLKPFSRCGRALTKRTTRRYLGVLYLFLSWMVRRRRALQKQSGVRK